MKPLFPDVTVNGEVIPAAVIAAEAQNHRAPKSKPGVAWQAAARALAIRAILLQEARARGLYPAPRETAPGKIETPEEALIRQLLDEAVEPVVPDDAALRAIHAGTPDRFRAPTLYEAAHILLPVVQDKDDIRDAQAARAGAILAELAADPGRFDALAREHSACASAEAGGRLGQIVSGDTVPEFEAALDGLDEGQIASTPVRTRYGIHIVRLDARARGEVLPYEAVADALRAAQEKAAWVAAAHAFVADLASRADISGVSLEPA